MWVGDGEPGASDGSGVRPAVDVVGDRKDEEVGLSAGYVLTDPSRVSPATFELTLLLALTALLASLAALLAPSLTPLLAPTLLAPALPALTALLALLLARLLASCDSFDFFGAVEDVADEGACDATDGGLGGAGEGALCGAAAEPGCSRLAMLGAGRPLCSAGLLDRDMISGISGMESMGGTSTLGGLGGGLAVTEECMDGAGS